MRIAVDMDEVLYSWERTARYLLRNVYPFVVERENADGTHTLIDLRRPFTEWYLPDVVGQDAYDWLFNEGVEAGLFRHGHVITGAMLGVRALKAAGHELIVVTHRPENGVQDTLAWLDFHFGREQPYPWSGLAILSGGEPKTEVRWDMLIDDSPKNIADALEAGREGIKFGAAWNDGGADWDSITKELT